MTKKQKIIIGAAVVLVIAFIVWGGYKAFLKTNTAETLPEKPIKIGVVAPLTGSVAFIGESLKNAILLSKDEYGDTKHKYEIIFEDDQMNPKMTAGAVNKLISVDKVNAIISVTAGTGNIISPIAEQNKILHFGIANDAGIARGDYNFLHTIPPAESARVFASELKNRGIKKLAIFELNQEGVIVLRRALEDELKKSNIEIVAEKVFNTGDRDFKSAIVSAKQNKPDIYMLMFFSPELEILAKQIKDMKINTPLTSIQAFDLTKEKALFEGYWYVSFAEPNADFVDRFEKKYGSAPAVGAANAYDILSLFVRSTERVDVKGGIDNDKIRQSVLRSGSFEGILGKTNVNGEGIIISPPAVKMIKNGKPVNL